MTEELEYEQTYWRQMEDLYCYYVLALHGGFWVYIDTDRCLFPVARCKRP